ncbi:MAG: S-adenosylmethionine:tRNA ribosyltransferase-isomerase, partial [Candidatus Firestonebacteria bacterium]
GRYDELLAIFDKEVVPAVGFGVGDVVIKDMLETYGLIPNIKSASDLHICVMDKNSIGYAQDLAQKTRDAGIKTTVDYSGKRVGDQIKYADKNKIGSVAAPTAGLHFTPRLIKKIKAKGIAKGSKYLDIVNALNTKRKNFESLWKTRLQDQMTDLPHFDKVYRELTRELKPINIIT